MPQFQKKSAYLADGEEAPDPVDVALAAAQEKQAEAVTTGSPATLAEALIAIADALKTLKAGDNTSATHLAGIEALLLQQERTRPHENLFNPPLISHFNPLGERDHPRPDLKCKMFWVGYEATKDGLTREEIDLFNRMQPGEFRVTKADGSTIPFSVGSRYADSGALEHMTFHFPCKNDTDRHNHASKTSYLREVLEGASPSVSGLLAEVAALKARLLMGGVPA